jgi:membrane-associated phospholipid phosphatase
MTQRSNVASVADKAEGHPVLQNGARAGYALNGFLHLMIAWIAVQIAWFAMQLISSSGSALAWQIVLVPVAGWLLWRRLPRLALFVVITAAGSSLLNTVVKTSVHRLRPVLTHPGRP